MLALLIIFVLAVLVKADFESGDTEWLKYGKVYIIHIDDRVVDFKLTNINYYSCSFNVGGRLRTIEKGENRVLNGLKLEVINTRQGECEVKNHGPATEEGVAPTKSVQIAVPRKPVSTNLSNASYEVGKPQPLSVSVPVKASVVSRIISWFRDIFR